MGTATSRKEEPETNHVNDYESGDSKRPTDEEQNEYKGDKVEDDKEPVIEEEIVPTNGIQVRSIIRTPVVS